MGRGVFNRGDPNIVIRVRAAHIGNRGTVRRPGGCTAGAKVNGGALPKSIYVKYVLITLGCRHKRNELARRRPDEIGHLVAFTGYGVLGCATLDTICYIG